MTTSPERALVLGGGGAAGNAWEIGVVAGLASVGVDLTTANLVVGTSAGATAAAQLTSGADVAELYAATLLAPPPRGGGPGGPGAAGRPGAGGPPALHGQSYLEWSGEIIAASSDPADMRRRLGAAALALDTSDGAASARWREVVAARLPGSAWPERTVLITAFDARTGAAVVLDRDSGLDLVDAVAASTSALTPYRVGDQRYLDGGYRRGENADLAAGAGSVVVLAPFGGRTRMPAAWGMDLATQVAELREAGSQVATVFPDAAAGDVFNAGALDPATRPQAARAGHAQGVALARSLRDLWG